MPLIWSNDPCEIPIVKIKNKEIIKKLSSLRYSIPANVIQRLKKIKDQGVTRKLMGVKIDHDQIDMYCEKTLFDDDNNIIGFVRSATYSPTFKKVIGIAMINKPYWNSKNSFKIEINEKIHLGNICDLPFI